MSKYEDAVAEARRLVKRSEDDQWRLAELTWQQIRHNGITQRRWAKDVGIASSSYVGGLARLWERFGQQADRPSFAAAMREVHTPGRSSDAEEHGSIYAAEARVAVRNAPPERKAEIVRELLREPEVVARVEHDIVEHVASSPRRTAQTIERAAEVRPAPRRPEREPNQLDYLSALGVGSTAIVDARKLAGDVSTLVEALRNDALQRDPGAADAITEDIAGLRRSADMLRIYADELQIALEGGVSDERLQALLDGER